MVPLRLPEPNIRIAMLHVAPVAYTWESGWVSKGDSDIFYDELDKALTPLGFIKKSGTHLYSNADSGQDVSCGPTGISYRGKEDGVSRIEAALMERNSHAFYFIGTDIEPAYDMSKDDINKALEDNKDIIRKNIVSYVNTGKNNGVAVGKTGVIDSVFMEINFLGDNNDISSNPVFLKVRDVFDNMVKNKELSIDRDGIVSVRKAARKRQLTLSLATNKGRDEEVVHDGR